MTPLHQFLAVLFPRLADCIDLRALPSKAQAFVIEPDVLKSVDEFVASHRQENLYFGVATRVERNGTLSGSRDSCGIVSALWVDVDFKAVPCTGVGTGRVVDQMDLHARPQASQGSRLRQGRGSQ